MIFISESGLLDTTRKAEWDAWYLEHLRIMLTVPGITSAQRFETDTPGYPPSLAIYTVRSAAVFTDPHYLSIRGFGPWQPLIDPAQYRRNLFSGLDRAPHVNDHQRLLVVDRAEPSNAMGGIEFVWLECVGLDRSTAFRGLAVVEISSLPTLGSDAVVYAPTSS